MTNPPDTPQPHTTRVRVSEEGRHYINLPESFWQHPKVKEATRFDMVTHRDGTIILQPCPHSDQRNPQQHHTDVYAPWEEEGNVCGLTKWVCLCGNTNLVESEDAFPEGWVDVVWRDGYGDVKHSEAYCTAQCAVAGLNKTVAQPSN